MATLQTSKVASTVQSRGGIDITSVTAIYTLTAALALNDVIEMLKVPKGATMQEVILSCSDLDTNGTPLISLEVGDGSDTDRYIASNTVGRTGGLARMDSHAGHGYTYTAEDTIDVKVVAAPATGATSGTVTVTAIYTMQS